MPVASSSHILIDSGAILTESFLSYLGLGLPNLASWGYMASEGNGGNSATWRLILPALLISTIFAFNTIGDGLRDALDPKCN